MDLMAFWLRSISFESITPVSYDNRLKEMDVLFLRDESLIFWACVVHSYETENVISNEKLK